MNEVKRAKERVERLERAIDEADRQSAKALQELIAALQTLRGVAKIGAATLVTEVGRFSRFDAARTAHGLRRRGPERALERWLDAPRLDHEDGQRATCARSLGEAAWSYRNRPAIGPEALKKRQRGQSEEVKAIAWKAQHRLHERFQKALRAVESITAASSRRSARELLGFVWAIGCTIEKQHGAAA